MIDCKFHGQRIKNISFKNFTYGFEEQDRYPGLVLASLNTVPLNVSDDWILATNDCGGMSCNSCEAAILELTIRTEMLPFLEYIAGERFSPKPLDYFSMMDESMTETVREGYRGYLRQVGLTCNDENINLLTQALYPIDATADNVLKLSDQQVDISNVNVKNGLVLFIVGVSCD